MDKNLTLDPQNPPDVVVHICEPSIPLMKWEWETGRSLQAHTLASLVCTAASNKRPCLKEDTWELIHGIDL